MGPVGPPLLSTAVSVCLSPRWQAAAVLLPLPAGGFPCPIHLPLSVSNPASHAFIRLASVFRLNLLQRLPGEQLGSALHCDIRSLMQATWR